MRILFAAALALLSVGPARAAKLDDSDLSDPVLSAQSAAALPGEGRLDGEAVVFPLSVRPKSSLAGSPGFITGRLVLIDREGKPQAGRSAKVRLAGQAVWTETGSDGRFSLKAPEGRSEKIRVSLDNRHWEFRSDEDAAYEWESGPVASGTDIGELSPTAGSENAKLAVLHLTYLEAVDFLAREADVRWWKKPLTVVWPGGADYYSPGQWTLHLTNPLAWDVVLHELGHAVMAGAMDARTSGGSHKIDECYSLGLAWSEGWASFFAAAVHLSPDDADAKFEFMVPRRSPIRVENVPADVCKGPTSEWRVFAGLWDLYDRHADAEGAALGFAPIWKGTTSGVTAGIGDAWTLIASGLDPAARGAADGAMRLNTLLPPKAVLVKLPSLPHASGRLFDGR